MSYVFIEASVYVRLSKIYLELRVSETFTQIIVVWHLSVL